jgi:hypothetical protein
MIYTISISRVTFIDDFTNRHFVKVGNEIFAIV